MNPFRPTGTHSGAAAQDRKVTKYPQAGGGKRRKFGLPGKKTGLPPQKYLLVRIASPPSDAVFWLRGTAE